MYRHILTATDGSEWAGKGLSAAIDLAAALGAELSIMTALEPYPEYLVTDGYMIAADFDRMREAAAATAAEILRQAKALAAEKGVEAKTHYVASGPAAWAITEEAEGLGCDLIVIGSRGRRGLTKLILGSQAAEVLAGTHLPVLIVK